MNHLMTHIANELPTKWYIVGIQLLIETSTLDAFEEQDISRRFVKVFDQWKKEQKVPYTWNTIIAALEAAGK